MSNQQIYKIIETIVLALLTCCAVALGMTSCKVWRTISTTATYTKTSPQTLSQGEGERRESRPKRRLSCVTILSSKLRTRARRRYIVREYGDATLQKPWCPHSYFCGPQPQKNVFAIVHTPMRMRGGREVVQQIRQCGRERGREDERMKG